MMPRDGCRVGVREDGRDERDAEDEGDSIHGSWLRLRLKKEQEKGHGCRAGGKGVAAERTGRGVVERRRCVSEATRMATRRDRTAIVLANDGKGPDPANIRKLSSPAPKIQSNDR
jgi:hypothetical protein